ncbi:hypothetical protein BRYFOR_06585 [Marvinbryantia formatexigens DSM 14469]|uniref:Uncharacterized protein n=1 Tax=Marvinbryantia formatexigens DSM 14469 TaxID=478749 RepID=C6LDH6_9FIRM|nr:hypothetical protein BRYFOR_06585 [Marvinbryantia formatexigens DSM 14469]
MPTPGKRITGKLCVPSPEITSVQTAPSLPSGIGADASSASRTYPPVEWLKTLLTIATIFKSSILEFLFTTGPFFN